jgi:small neutral amino acid transporter SnatA (MarC family)
MRSNVPSQFQSYCSGPVCAAPGKSGIDAAISRVMGFLLICIRVQFEITGIFELLIHLRRSS